MTHLTSLQKMPPSTNDRPHRAGRLGNPSLAALVVLPLGVLAAVSVLRELSEPRQPVHGQILVDGVPYRGVELTFYRSGRLLGATPVARAWTDSQGKFQVRSLGVASGLPSGEYIATARCEGLEISGEALTRGGNTLDRQYADPRTSPLRLLVGPGTNQLGPWQLASCRCESSATRLARR